MRNVDKRVVDGFGEEWQRFDQAVVSDEELKAIFELYFEPFPWHLVSTEAVGIDIGCGSGRWARFVAPRVGILHCVDASQAALAVARQNLAAHTNCRFHHASADEIPLDDQSMDFGYSLGVLHHVPDTEQALRNCVRKLRPGAPFLLYLYYAFDNRPLWYRWIWAVSEIPRALLSRSPKWIRFMGGELIAATIYYPLAAIARLLERSGRRVDNFPLSSYRHLSFYTMRTDALDRFGTRLERRFRRDQIAAMMHEAGLIELRFNERAAFWTASGIKG